MSKTQLNHITDNCFKPEEKSVWLVHLCGVYCTVRADKSLKISGEMWDKFFTIRQYSNFYVHHPEGGEKEKII